MIQYTCIQSEPALWTTGYTDPAGKWQPESDHDSRARGFQRAAWLNGDAGGGHVYLRSEPGLWTVGTYAGDRFDPVSDHHDREEAAIRAAGLNGSDPAAWTVTDTVAEHARQRTAELLAMAEDENWLGDLT